VIKALDEHERSMAFAEVALGQIRSLRQTAVPRNYEIWYVYATGYNSPLNKIINETLARNGKLTEADLEQIYETYLSQVKTTDRIDKVGARVIGEIDDVMNLITEALGMSASYDKNLTGATEKLAVARNADQVQVIVDSLVKSTRDMRETNKALEDRLSLSISEISNLQQSLEAIRAESLTDPLTGLGNRKYFDRSIDMAVQNALASGEPLSLLMFDIDHFKSFNDSYGHLTGDQVLRLVGMSHRFTDRARGRLPLRCQTQRPQPGDLRSGSGIYDRDAYSGRLTRYFFPVLFFFVAGFRLAAGLSATALFALRILGRLPSAAR
jgi:diguanylate cyclase